MRLNCLRRLRRKRPTVNWNKVRVLDFTYTLSVVFYNRGDQLDFKSSQNLSQALPVFSRSVPYHTVRSRSFRERSDVAQVLRYRRSMEATQSYPNLLSEKQAAKRLGVARITLLRAREAGRIRFFRIGTRVLYCAEQLTEFLTACERNGHKRTQPREKKPRGEAARKENRVSSGRVAVDRHEGTRTHLKSDPRKRDQATLPFATSR